jgi:hypothetical protein
MHDAPYLELTLQRCHLLNKLRVCHTTTITGACTVTITTAFTITLALSRRYARTYTQLENRETVATR